MKRRTLLATALALPLAACAGSGPGGPSGDTVLGVARTNGLTGFSRAVEAAGLAETLAGPGPYTVFAPSNRALSAAALPRDPEALQRLLAYHVVPGDFDTAFLAGLDVNYTTAAGDSVEIDGTGTAVVVDGARIVTPDLEAGNGVVHVIDRVLDPR